MAKYPTSIDFLDRLARKIGAEEHYPNGVATDYRIAQILGVTKAAVSQVRKKKHSMGSVMALKTAELLGEDEGYMLACLQVERAQNEQVKRVWERVAKGAAVAVFSLGLWASSPSPAPVNESGTSGPVYITSNRRRLPQRRYTLTACGAV